MPTEKAPAIESLLTSIAGISRQEAEDRDICTWCREPVLAFKDALSRREYQISGFCQKCQDDTFGA